MFHQNVKKQVSINDVTIRLNVSLSAYYFFFFVHKLYETKKFQFLRRKDRFEQLSLYGFPNACILVYDIADLKSFNEMETLHNDILEILVPEHPEKFPFLLCGNKNDLNPEGRVVSVQQGMILAQKYRMAFYETSRFDKTNIDLAVNHFAAIASGIDTLDIEMVVKRWTRTYKLRRFGWIEEFEDIIGEYLG
ncbi:hypothetical protein RFI_28863, partial [Reticulomyxa filosa]